MLPSPRRTFQEEAFPGYCHDYHAYHDYYHVKRSCFLIIVMNIMITRPSILCVTHQMMNYKWYLMVLGQYMTVLAGTWSV